MVVPSQLSITYNHLPISSFSGWDRVWQIEAALNLHDHGLFRDSAFLMDAMMRDDRIGAASDTRIAALLSCPVEYKPANASVKAARICDEIGGDADEPGLHAQMFPPAQVGELAWGGRFLGFGVAEIIWTTTGTGKQKRWIPRLCTWHPQFIYWDWSTFRYVVICAEGTVYLPDTDKEVHSNGNWFIYTPMGYRWGWLKGLVRRLAHKYIMRGWNYRDWARYNERHGMPIIKAIHPPSALKDARDRFIRSVATIGSDAVVPLPAKVPASDGNPEQPGYDVDLVEAQAKTHETFQLFKQELDSDITTAILGQDVTTNNTGGSLAKAQVADRITIDKRKEDASIADYLHAQVLWWYAQYNYGDGNLAPIPTYQVEPPEDETEEGAALLALGQGVRELIAADPDGIDVPTIWDRFGIPMVSEQERAQRQKDRLDAAAQAQQRMLPPTNDNGNAGGAGDGGDEKDGPPLVKRKSLSAAPPRVQSRYKFQGIDVAIEHPQGSRRTWTEKNPDGTENIGTTEMQHDYGFIVGQLGGDDEGLDCYIGPDENAPDVHVVHQLMAPDFKGPDEDKVFLGFPSHDAARASYIAHRNDGTRAIGSISSMPLATFKKKLARRTQSTRPIRATYIGPDTLAAAAEVGEIGRMLISMMDRAEALKTKPGRGPKASRRGKLYGDLVADRAIRTASGIFAPDLVGLRSDVEAATDYDDLRKRVIARFKHKMDPQRLASLVEKARLMAHLGGRLAAIKSL